MKRDKIRKSVRVTAKLAALLMLLLALPGCQDRVKHVSETEDGLEVGEYPVVIKTIPSLRYAYQPVNVNKRELEEKTREVAGALLQSIGPQKGVNIIGPLTHVMDNLSGNATDVVNMQVGFPLDGEPQPSEVYGFRELDEFHCLTIRVPLTEKFTRALWFQMHRAALKKGLQPNGQGRTVITFNDTGSNYVMELQLGVRS